MDKKYKLFEYLIKVKTSALFGISSCERCWTCYFFTVGSYSISTTMEGVMVDGSVILLVLVIFAGVTAILLVVKRKSGQIGVEACQGGPRFDVKVGEDD